MGGENVITSPCEKIGEGRQFQGWPLQQRRQ